MDGERKDFERWMEEGKRRERHYKMDEGGEGFTKWMKKGKTLQDEWRRGRL